MPKRLINEIKLSRLGHYQLWEEIDHAASDRRDIEPDSPEYFIWLSTLKSFHFEGKEGRFTARLEKYKNKDGSTRQYWSAYRKHNKKQLRRYLGTTDKLTIAKLEDAAKHLTDVCNSQGPKVKAPRKKPTSRAVLNARIDRLEKELETERALHQAKELEQEQLIEQQRARIRQLEAAIKTKRETLEL